ncbi:MAG: helix-turn-helix transcriptional regulator [Lachnospiraceae bacterium]|nr:helix-turn-helix transcriptional regulator [Lachnospiraceae bacterium]
MLSQRLKNLRIEKRITQAELANVLNVSSRTIASYEQGVNEPNITTILALCDYFNVSTDYLLGYSDFKNAYSHDAFQKAINSVENEAILDLYQTTINCAENFSAFSKSNSQSTTSEISSFNTIMIHHLANIVSGYYTLSTMLLNDSNKCNIARILDKIAPELNYNSLTVIIKQLIDIYNLDEKVPTTE